MLDDKNSQLSEWEPRLRYLRKDTQRIADYWHIAIAMVAQSITKLDQFMRPWDSLIMPSGIVTIAARGTHHPAKRRRSRKHVFACHRNSAFGLSCGYLAIP